MTEQVFLELIKANQGIIYKLVGLYAYDAEEKRDLYQEVLLQTWKSIDSFRGEAKFSTWLYRICLNTILTQKRKNSRIDFKESLEELPHSVQHLSEEKQDSIRLRQAIRKLAETDRAIVSMHLDGYTNPEIADVMGISHNHVAVKLHRIKQQLANLLNP